VGKDNHYHQDQRGKSQKQTRGRLEEITGRKRIRTKQVVSNITKRTWGMATYRTLQEVKSFGEGRGQDIQFEKNRRGPSVFLRNGGGAKILQKNDPVSREERHQSRERSPTTTFEEYVKKGRERGRLPSKNVQPPLNQEGRGPLPSKKFQNGEKQPPGFGRARRIFHFPFQGKKD